MGLYGNKFLVLENRTMSMEDYLDSLDESKKDKIIKNCKSKIDTVVKEANKIIKELKISNIAHVENIDIEDIIEDYEDINYPMDYIPFISFKKIDEDQFLDYINSINKKLKEKISYKGLKATDYDGFTLLLNLSKEFFV